MRTLLLLRHAKSSWAAAGTSDRDRSLNERGEQAAIAMGGYMRSHSLSPDLVLISPARRTRDTWKLVAQELTETPRLIVDESLYDFGSGEAILEAVKQRGTNAEAVMMVIAHNPAIQQLARRLIGAGDPELIGHLEHKYPTAALAQIVFDAKDWTKLTDGSGTLITF